VHPTTRLLSLALFSSTDLAPEFNVKGHCSAVTSSSPPSVPRKIGGELKIPRRTMFGKSLSRDGRARHGVEPAFFRDLDRRAPVERSRSPPEPGTEIFDAETRLKNPAFRSPETDVETIGSGQKPALRGKNAKTPDQVRTLKTGWWAHQGSNLGPDD
jgi:hypothetical protein